MNYRTLKNLRGTKTEKCSDLSVLVKPKPAFTSKAEFRDWSAASTTDHVFYSACEGRAPAGRINNENPVNKIGGFIADYDAPVDWTTLEDDITTRFKGFLPTWRSKTHSNYLRLVWEFTEQIPIDPASATPFLKAVAKKMKAANAFAGFDEASYKPNQYFELGEDWVRVADPLSEDLIQGVWAAVVNAKPPATSDVSIPIEIVAKGVDEKFPNRWVGDFEVGSRGPLFWVDDGIDRDGCMVVEDGMVCYSDRAGQGFMSWADIFGRAFVKDYEERRLSGLLDEYWFNGRSFFKLLYDQAVTVPRDQMLLEFRQNGFSTKIKKGQQVSEVEAALLTVSNHNRIDEIAPVVFSPDRIVSYNGSRILNCGNLEPVSADSDGDPSKWPFLHDWLGQLFVNSGDVPTLDYFYAWLKRFYEAVVEKKQVQGQALVLVGPTGRGKSLLSNKVISGLVGGFADASQYVSGHTNFNKDLGRVAAWVIDDTTSASSFQDQRKATEILKRAVANPRVEYQAKYADSMSIPWTGRVIMSLNMDANSLSVIPSLDSSNRDKLMALLISEDSTTEFPPNHDLEDTIEKELPHLARFLLNWAIPKEVGGTGRFGVKSFIDPKIADAAYDNSSRSAIAELVEFFAQKHREVSPDVVTWEGTLTKFQVDFHCFTDGRTTGKSNSLEFIRMGMATLEDAGRVNKSIRPVTSKGNGGGKIWKINLSSAYDIDVQMSKI